MQLLMPFIVALAVTMALIPVLMRCAGRLDLLDEPDVRKVHTGKVPRVGGLGMVAGAVVAALLWVPYSNLLGGVLASVLVLVAFTIADDIYELNYKWKFLGQVLAACIAVLIGGVSIQFLPFAGFDAISDMVGVPLSVLALVAATNAVNLSDGLDGLAGGVVLLALVGVLVLAVGANAEFIVVLTVIVMAAILGFLRFNTHPAIVFMGDTGSQFLGFILALLALQLTQIESPALNPTIPLLLLGMPILDTSLVMIKRIREGRSPFTADKNHLHHRLLGAGFAHYEAVFLIYVSQACFVLLALALKYESDIVIVGLYLFFTLVLIATIRLLEKQNRLKKYVSGATYLTRAIATIDAWAIKINFPYLALNTAFPVFIVMVAIFSESAGRDMTIVAALVCAALFMRLVLGMKAAVLSLRLMLYIVMAMTVYLGIHSNTGETTSTNVFTIIMLAIIAVAGVLAMRYDRQGAFKTTPTDFLILAITIALGVISRNWGLPDEFGRIVVGIVIAFYAAEIYIRNMKTRWNPLTVSSLLSVGIIAVKGII